VDKDLSTDQYDDLSSFSALLLSNFLDQSVGDHELAKWKLSRNEDDFILALAFALGLYTRGVHFEHVRIPITQFLLGYSIQSISPDSESDLTRFYYNMKDLSHSGRAATETRDYVTAIWVDCPGYQIPINYKSMDLPYLLEDAVKQFEKNHRHTFVVQCPLGLFSDVGPSALWRPSRYLSADGITESWQVYAAIPESMTVLPITPEGAIALHMRNARAEAITHRSSDYYSILGKR
jgi:hypothetical protein